MASEQELRDALEKELRDALEKLAREMLNDGDSYVEYYGKKLLELLGRVS